VRRTTGYSAFRLLYGHECILPIEFSTRSWATVDWEAVESHEDLIAARMKLLDERELDEAIAAEKLERARLGDKRYFDKKMRMCGERQVLSVGALGVVFDGFVELLSAALLLITSVAQPFGGSYSNL